MRNNPVPVVLTLAGITWLVASSYNSRQPPGQDLSSRFSRSGVGQKLQQRAQTARERIQSTAMSAREKLHSRSESGEEWSSTSGSSSGRLSNAMHSARDNASVRAREMQDRVYSMMNEQPLVLGALAVAVGAIIGTAIPSTQYENRVLGTARDRTLTKAQELGQQQYESLKETVQQATQSGQGQSSGTSQSGINETLAGRA